MLYESETPYQYLQVAETSQSRWLLLGSSGLYYQSIFNKNSILTGRYYDYFYLLPFLMSPNEPVDILIIGLAGGTMSRGLKHFFPNSRIDGVEIDPEVIQVAKDYFELDSQDITVINQGGRQYLNETKKTYDIIILDAFSNEQYIPWHLSTSEFFKLVQMHLNKDGIFAINSIEKFDDLNSLVTNTVSSVFNYTYHHPEAQQELRKQIIASNSPLAIEKLSIDITHPLYIYSYFYKDSLTPVRHEKRKDHLYR